MQLYSAQCLKYHGSVSPNAPGAKLELLCVGGVENKIGDYYGAAKPHFVGLSLLFFLTLPLEDAA